MSSEMLSELKIVPQVAGDELDDGGISNVGRALAAQAALSVFAKEMFSLDEEAETVLSDFLADLLHLCRMTGMNFDECLERGRGHFREENHIAREVLGKSKTV